MAMRNFKLLPSGLLYYPDQLIRPISSTPNICEGGLFIPQTDTYQTLVVFPAALLDQSANMLNIILCYDL